MPRGYRSLQLSFSGGEMSPDMLGRFDDARARAGAARLRNFISHPDGAAARRPGFEMVRKVKDSTRAVRLLPFRFSTDQTYAIEMGRAVVDGRDIGYFRFHSDGGTLLQMRPDDYRAPLPSNSLNVGNDQFLVGANSYQTGDPIVFTVEATTDTVTFSAGATTVTDVAHGFLVTDLVMFRTDGSLPPELTPGQIYYIVAVPTADTFRISKKRGGQPITFSSAGAGTHKVASLPSVFFNGNNFPVDVNTTYYLIVVDATHVQVAPTRADALAGNAFNWTTVGTIPLGDLRIHYDYRPGSVAFDNVNGSPFYCRKTPWGTPGALQVFLNDHLDHPTTNTIYWVRQPGEDSVVTFNTGTDRVNWTTNALTDGDPITFEGGTLPTPLVEGTVYYVRNRTLNDFQVSASLPGPVLNLGGAPAGTTIAFANGIYEVPHHYAESVLFEINTTQSNDVLTLVHMDRPAAELQRLGPTHWVLSDVRFNQKAAPPSGVEATAFLGEGITPNNTGAGTPATLTTSSPHTLASGQTVRTTDINDIPAGYYVVATIPSPTTLTLKTFDDGAPVGSVGGVPAAGARIWPTDFQDDRMESYVVTSVDEDDEESNASAEVTVDSDLLANGAYNTITWDAVPNAHRYRVYKKLNGLFGYIGEVDALVTSFVDDNIAPDLAVTPPIRDQALRMGNPFIGFDTTTDTVLWTAHPLEEGMPVVFDTNGTLPTGLTYGATYYVLNPEPDAFQLAATPGSTTPVNLSGSPSGEHVALSGHFPSAVTYFEQRRVFAGSRLRPQDFWMTASGTESDLSYSIPTVASDRIHNRLAARERSQILHAVPAGHLIFLTSAAEYRLTPLNDDALSPTSVAARAPTHVGVSTVAPVIINNVVLFPSARGGHLREMGFSDRVGDYITGDVCLRAVHLFENRRIVQLTYSAAPNPIVWVVSDSGTLLGFSYAPEEQVAGWHEHDIDGTIESAVAVAEHMEDRLYIIAKRGSTRYVERLGCQCVESIEDAFFVDSGVTYSGAPVSQVFVPHLAGQAVVFLADGIEGAGTVSVGGLLTLPVASSVVHVGLAYDDELRTLPLAMQVDAALGSGRTKNVSAAWVRVRQSGRFQVGPELTAMSDAPAPEAGTLATQLVQVSIVGEWTDEGQVYVRSNSSPLPLTVVGLTLELASGA